MWIELMGGGLPSFAYASLLHTTVVWFYVFRALTVIPSLHSPDVCVIFCGCLNRSCVKLYAGCNIPGRTVFHRFQDKTVILTGRFLKFSVDLITQQDRSCNAANNHCYPNATVALCCQLTSAPAEDQKMPTVQD